MFLIVSGTLEGPSFACERIISEPKRKAHSEAPKRLNNSINVKKARSAFPRNLLDKVKRKDDSLIKEKGSRRPLRFTHFPLAYFI